MRKLFLSALLICLSTFVSAEETQLDFIKSPREITINGQTYHPDTEYVVLYTDSKVLLRNALNEEGEKLLEGLLESPRYIMSVRRSALKSEAELKELASSGKLPVIHPAYRVRIILEAEGKEPQVIIPPIYFFFGGIIYIEVAEGDSSREEVLRLAESLNLLHVQNKEMVSKMKPNALYLELHGKSQYDVVFNVHKKLAASKAVELAEVVFFTGSRE